MVYRKFTRPSVSIDEPGTKKDWRSAQVGSLSEGDLIVDFGAIEDIASSNGMRTFRNPLGSTLTLTDTDTVYAFTAAGANA